MIVDVHVLQAARLCLRCRHPHDWHRLDDALNLDPTDPTTPFRCLGFDPSVDGPLSTCDCPDLLWVAS